MPAMSTQALRPSRSWYLLAGVAVAGSIVWLALGLLLGFRSLTREVDAFQRVPIPGQAEVSLAEPGGYLLYLEAPGVSAEGAAIPSFNVLLTAADGGEPVPLHPYGGSVTYSLGGHAGRAVGSFQIDRPGRFLLQTNGLLQGPAQVAVGRSIGGDIVVTVLRTLAGTLVLFFGGAALAVVVAIRRQRARRLLPAPAVQGWSAALGAPQPGLRRYVLQQRIASPAGAFTITDQ